MAHTHYSGTGKMHTFRGLLANDAQDKIRIQGSVGALAWRITKLQIITSDPMDASDESVVKIYRESQSAVTNAIDFTEDELLAAAFISHNQTSGAGSFTEIVFDNALFSRNIHITASANPGPVNYYIELEEIKVSAAGMAQLAVAAARRTTGGGA